MSHLLTDVGGTLVLTALMFTRHGEPRRFTDLADNCTYWNFVVPSLIPLWALIDPVPRLAWDRSFGTGERGGSAGPAASPA